jgi:flagellar hook-length control protein FliK
MAEMSPTSSTSQKVLAALTELRNRTGVESDDNGANFVDIMMARVTAHQSTKDGLKDIIKDHDASAAVSDRDYKDRWVEQARHAQASKKTDNSTKSVHTLSRQEQAALHQKRSAQSADQIASAQKAADAKVEQCDTADDKSVKQIESVASTQSAKEVYAAQQASKDEKAFRGLKEVAKLLLDAEKEGTLTLPDSVKSVLEKIAGTDAAEAGQALPLLQNLLTVLRNLEDSKTAQDLQKTLGNATWGEDVAALFSDLQVNVGIKAGQQINLGKLIKALRALSHIAQSGNKGDAEQLVPNTAAMALVMNREPSSAAVSDDPALIPDPLAAKKKADKERLAALVGDGLHVPNSQQKPDLSNNPLNPMVKPERSLEGSRDISDAFARGAQQGRSGGEGAGRAAAAQIVQAAATGGKNMAFDAPKIDVASSATQSVQALGATAQAARAAVAAQTAPQMPHPATQQVMVQVQKFPITKDTQLNISLNPAELGRVDVKITIDQYGKATAVILADKPETLALLQKDGHHLEKALQQAGLNSSAQDLHYSLKEQAQQHDQQAGGRKRRALFEGDEEAKPLSVDTHIRDDGLPYRINYHA